MFYLEKDFALQYIFKKKATTRTGFDISYVSTKMSIIISNAAGRNEKLYTYQRVRSSKRFAQGKKLEIAEMGMLR